MFAFRARRFGVVAAVVVVVGGVLVGTVPAGASVPAAKKSPWSATTAALPANAAANPVSAVFAETCPAPGSCVSVGAYIDASGDQQGLIETLAGGVWTSVAAPLPLNAAADPDAAVTAITCFAVDSCVAVGGYIAKKVDGSGLIEVLSGGTWTPEQVVQTGFADVEFEGLSCPAAGSCVAVGEGSTKTGDEGVIATLSAGTWTLIAAPLPANTPTGGLTLFSSVTCSAVGSCVAVGTELTLGITSLNEMGFIETLSAGQWTASTAPLAAKKSSHPLSLLDSVACPAAGSCVAGGTFADKTHKEGEGLLESQSDGTWAPVDVPLPADAIPGQFGSFDGLSCPAAGTCVAVTDYVDASGNEQGLIETLSGGSWTATEAPLPADAGPDPLAALGAVSCPSAGSCVAVGSYIDTAGAEQGLVDTLSDGTWTATEAPLPPSTLNFAVGGSGSGSGSASAIATATDAALRSAKSSTFRLAPTVTRKDVRRVIENRTFSWARPATAGPASASGALSRASSRARTKGYFSIGPVLTLVSCATTDACVASGDLLSLSGEQAVTDTLSAGTWTTSAVVPADAVENTQAELEAVTCGASASCLADGTYNDANGNTQGLVETQTGGSWSPAEVPAPADAAADPEIDLDGGACPAAGSCLAVGEYLDAEGNEEGLVETLAGGSWTASSVPLPTGSTDVGADLSSIVCPEAGSCVAVGNSSSDGFVEHALIETLSDGTWTGSTPTVPGKSNARSGSELASVSCAAVGSCQAVGGYASGRKTAFGLVETLSDGTWTPTSVPPPGSGTTGLSELSGVSCAAVTACQAVGSYLDSEGEYGFIDTLNDGTWTSTTAPSPAKSAESSASLTGVSCPTSSACVAVGSYLSFNASTGEPSMGNFFDTWHGQKWTSSKAPNPAGVDLSSLVSVSCTTATACVSVGYDETLTGSEDGLIEATAGS